MGVYTGGVFIPHNRTEKSKIFLVPASEKFQTSKNQEYFNISANAEFVNLIVSQNTDFSSAPVAAAVGGAIGAAIVAYDSQGFKVSPIVQPDNPEIIRDWFDGR